MDMDRFQQITVQRIVEHIKKNAPVLKYDFNNKQKDEQNTSCFKKERGGINIG